MKLTTDELVEKIVSEIGCPLPTYDYRYHKYISVIPDNISFGDSTIGIEKSDMHDSFKGACLRIVNWHEGFENNLLE